ncbi:TonB-dependent receptor SusC [anaerobic digester metagenome]
MKRLFSGLFCLVVLLFNATAQEKNDSIVGTTSYNQVIKIGESNQKGVSDFSYLLQAEAVGVSFTKKGSDPTVSNSPVIRGKSSDFSLGVLFIVDGIYSTDISYLHPDDIASIVILKDATETALYGGLGMDGVIIINTKQGDSNKKLKVDFNSFLSLNSTSKRHDLLSAKELRSYVTENNLTGFFDGGASTDWQDEIFRSSISQSYNLSLSGKLSNTRYRVSLTHQTNPGVVISSGREVSGVTLSLAQKALNNKLDVRLNGSFARFESTILPSYAAESQPKNLFYQAFKRNTTDPVYNDQGDYYQSMRDFAYYNPMAIIEHTSNIETNSFANVGIGASYRISNHLVTNATFGYSNSNSDLNYLQAPEAYNGSGSNAYYKVITDKTKTNIDLSASYSKQIFATSNIDVSLGFSNRMYSNELDGLAYGFDLESHSEFVCQSIYAKASYAYLQRYSIGALLNKEFSKTSFRYSGPENTLERSNLFYALSLGWDLKQEAFLRNNANVNSLKLRLGYGITGNYYADYYAYHMAVASIDSLKVETATELSFGFDFSILKNRVGGSFTYYIKDAKNAVGLITVPMPPNQLPFVSGNSTWYNNSGFEILLNTVPVKTNKLEWISIVSLFGNANKLVETKDRSTKSGQTYYRGSSEYTQIIEEGSSTQFYLPRFAGEYRADGWPLFYTESGGKTSNTDLAKFEEMGQYIPRYELGWANTIKFTNGIECFFKFRYAGGYSIYNVTRLDLSNANYFPTHNINREGLSNARNGYHNTFLSNQYLEDASYLRLDNVTVSYTLKPKNVKWGESYRFYVGANNLFTITSYSGFDPAGYSTGIDNYSVYPLSRSFIVGVSIGI